MPRPARLPHLLTLALGACCVPWHGDDGPRLPGRPDRLSTPAESEAARPRWDTHPGYAPPADPVVLAHAAPVAGAAEQGLLACTVSASLRETRLLARNQEPDLQGTLSGGNVRMPVVGADNRDTLLLTAPLARLAPGDILRVEVRDRQPFRVRDVGVLETGYTHLPVDLRAEGLAGRCEWVPREGVEKALAQPLQAARSAVGRVEANPSLDGVLDPIDDPLVTAATDLALAAGLVGWSDPRVAALTAEYDRRFAAWHARLGEDVRARAAGLPAKATRPAPGLTWGPGSLVVGDERVARYTGAGVGAGAAVLLPVTFDEDDPFVVGSSVGPADQLVLVDANGSHWPLTLGGTWTEAAGGSPGGPSGRSATLVFHVDGGHHYRDTPVTPAVVRARTDGGNVFVRVD